MLEKYARIAALDILAPVCMPRMPLFGNSGGAEKGSTREWIGPGHAAVCLVAVAEVSSSVS